MAQFPTVVQGGIQPNDRRLGKKIDASKAGELTIASFNIRNLGSRQRSLKDYAALADLVDEADVVLIQEAGLGVFRRDQVSAAERQRLDAVEAVLQVFLGDNWNVIRAEQPSGVGAGRETAIMAYRTQGQGFAITADWGKYADLGEKRDMALFQITMTQAGSSTTQTMTFGSVHLTPEDPDRGQQMIKVAQWLVEQGDARAIVMGDFNWGYKKTSGVENYKGEHRVRELHAQGKVFQLFHELSYLGKAKPGQLRTNMGFRKDGYFYDQFLTTPAVAKALVDGGKLLQDCGLLAFGAHSAYMKDAIERSVKQRSYGLNQYLSVTPIEESAHSEAVAKARQRIERQAQNDATWRLSDHRVVWMQLKVF